MPVGRIRPQSLGDRFRALLLRSEALRGYLLLSPTLLVMLADADRSARRHGRPQLLHAGLFRHRLTPTLDNYWAIIKPGEGNTYLGIPFPFETPIYTILLVKSLLMSLRGDDRRSC